MGALFSSLAAFVVAGAKPSTPLARAIVIVLVIKLCAIVGIRLFMFPDGAQPAADATAIARIIGPSTSPR